MSKNERNVTFTSDDCAHILTDAAKAKGISYQTLAALTGIPRVDIRHYLTGQFGDLHDQCWNESLTYREQTDIRALAQALGVVIRFPQCQPHGYKAMLETILGLDLIDADTKVIRQWLQEGTRRHNETVPVPEELTRKPGGNRQTASRKEGPKPASDDGPRRSTEECRQIIKNWRLKNPTGTRNACHDETGISYTTVQRHWDSVDIPEPKKVKAKDRILQYKKTHPDTTRAQASRDLGISHVTVGKYWNDAD